MTLCPADAEIFELLHRPRPRLGLRIEARVMRAFVAEGRTVYPGEVLRLPLAAALSADKLGLVQLSSEAG